MIKDLHTHTHTHRWVKLDFLFLTFNYIETLKSQRLYNHLHCLDYLTMLMNKHTHTCRPKLGIVPNYANE
jgi:hypothetical protein